jgi:hypothetical protein
MRTEMQEAMSKVTNISADPEVRILRRMELNSAIQQGDIYMHRVSPSQAKGKPLGTRQVAIGTNVGARHIVEGNVKVFEGVNLPPKFKGSQFLNQLLGPVVEAEDTFVLTHPEHAHHQLPAGTYQVTYQLDWATKERVLD